LKELKRRQIMENIIISGRAKTVFRCIKLAVEAEKMEKMEKKAPRTPALK